MAVEVSYADFDALKQTVEQHEVVVTGEAYGSQVRLRLAVPRARLDGFTNALADATRGRARVDVEVRPPTDLPKAGG